MPHPVLETDECIGCGICVDACPQGVLEIAGGVVVLENEDACVACITLKARWQRRAFVRCGAALISFFLQISRTPLMLIGIKNEKVTQGNCG